MGLRLDGAVHVWWGAPADLRPRVPTDVVEAWLDDEDRARYRRYHRAEDRELFLLARATLRHALSQYADVEPGGWRFRIGAYGRPELHDDFGDLGLRFNLSHTRGLVACVVHDRIDAGLDVESVRGDRDIPALTSMVCSDAERRALEHLPPGARAARFYEIWTLKEAYIKARGLGLTLPLREITFSGGAGDAISVGFAAPIEDQADDWRFALWRPSADHQGALALRTGSSGAREIVFRRALEQAVS